MMRITARSRTALALLVALAVASLVACGATQATTTQTQTVQVTLTDTGISVMPTMFHAGIRYRFVVTNHGTVSHEFLIMPPGMAQTINQMPMAQWHQQALHASGILGPGMMDSFDYAFTAMPMMGQGQYAEFGCYAAGYPLMHVPIDVRP
jgi:uncharacterized cupredoxin-like copper-binding protein